MNTYIISDTHWDHQNIIKYCNRPYSSVDEMNIALIKNWNRVVSKDDLVIHLGDFAMTRKRERVRELRSQLNGRIALVVGNHDNFDVDFYSEVFDFVCHSFVLHNIYFTHRPYEHITYTDFSLNVHGHIHNNLKDGYWLDPNLYMNVSCELTNYEPMNISKVLELKKTLGLK